MGDQCVLCGAKESEVLSTKLRHGKKGSVVRCLQCGLSRIKGARDYAAKLDDYYGEQYAEEYHTGVKKELDTLFESFLPVQEDRVQKIAPYLKPTDRVLEIGSSTGYFLHSLKPLVAEVQGIELNRKEAQYASEARQVPTSDAPHRSGVLPANHYDHVCLFQVLEHAADPIEFLNSIRRYLRPEGKVHIEVPNLMDPLVWLYDVEDYRDFYYQEPHLHYFTPETLTSVCQAANYQPVSVFGFQQTSLINNLNWVFLKRPQPSRWDCIQPTLPEGALRKDVSDGVKTELENLLTGFNAEYKSFAERNQLTDMIFATISI